MLGRTAVSGVVMLVATLVASLSASAAFPGQNGKIVFGSQHAGEDEIWVMNADGSDRHNLTRHTGAKVTDIDPRWSPDGKRIVFASDRTGSMQIWLMNANGSSPTQLTNLPGRNRYPAFTSDGKQIVFQSVVAGNFEIYRMRSDGGDVTNLTSDPGVEWSPATAPRGKRIVFTRERAGNGHLYIWSPDEPLMQATSGPGYDYLANWSPSGNDLVFTRFLDGQDEIYIAHADGTGERQLTDTPGMTELFPAFSPDGGKIVFTRCAPPRPAAAPNPVCSTHTMNPDGTGDVDLVFPTPPTQLPFTDDFDDNVRDVEHWNYIHNGVGASIREINQRVEVSFLADSVAPADGIVGASTGFNCLLEADFDAQADFELLEWPSANGVRVHMWAAFGGASIGRQSESWGEQYSASVDPSYWNGVDTADLSGSLRLVRTGGTFTSYIEQDGEWVELLQAQAPANAHEVIIVLVAASYGTFAHMPVRVAFDNFRVDADEDDVDCSPNRPDWHPDVQPLGR